MDDLPKTQKEKWRRTMFAAMDICAKGQEAPTPALVGDFYAFAEDLEAENTRLREALNDARNWVKSLSRQNGSGHWDLVKESPRFKRLEAALKETDQ